jgi:hypothetical protein
MYGWGGAKLPQLRLKVVNKLNNTHKLYYSLICMAK